MPQRTPRRKRREPPHWAIRTFVKVGDPTDKLWTAFPYNRSDLPAFTPYFSLSQEEFDRNLRKDLPALLHWLAMRYPQTADWPVFFEDGAPPVECGREVLQG